MLETFVNGTYRLDALAQPITLAPPFWSGGTTGPEAQRKDREQASATDG